jgi:hypothetical protein
MLSSGMLGHVVLIRTDVLEEPSASIIQVTRIGELGTAFVRRLLVTANIVASSPVLVNLMLEVLRSSETSVLIKTTQPNIPEDSTFLYTTTRS